MSYEHPDHTIVPDAPEMLGWIEHVCKLGIRRPGYSADEWTTEWVLERFHQHGLHDVHLEPVPLPVWDPLTWSLNVWRTDDPRDAFDAPCFPLPHSAPGEVEAPLLPLERGDVSGAIALDTVTLSRLPQTIARDLAIKAYDPDGDFETLVQTLPFGRQMQEVMEPAIEARAAAFVGVFDAPWDSCEYYVPYDGVERRIPGVWVSRTTGERLRDVISRGPVRARLAVDSSRETASTHNVVGTLPGAGAPDEWVVIASHHDGPWASAVEDASGIALVIAQARYWAAVPQAERPHNLLFLVTSGHMVHGSGTAAFIAQHEDFLERVVLEVHLEHTARECVGRDGRLVPTDAPEVRWWFTTRNDALVGAVEDALRAEDLRRSLIMPPDVFGPHPSTDGGFFHLSGVPLVNFLTAPMYLFDAQDTIDKIHVPSLEPVTRAAIRIIASTRGTSAAQMRSGQA